MKERKDKWADGELISVVIVDGRACQSGNVLERSLTGMVRRKFTRQVRAGRTSVPVVVYVTRRAVN